MRPAKYIKVKGHLYRHIPADPPDRITVDGREYVKVSAQPGDSYESQKASILEDGGFLDSVKTTLITVTNALVHFGQLVEEDNPDMARVLSSRVPEDAKLSSKLYDLGDTVAQLERLSDRMAANLRPPQRARP